jgi:hypothetical protein
MDLITILVAAAGEAEHSGGDATAYYVAGGLLAAFGFIAGAIGIARPNLGGGATRAMMAVGAILAAATMVATVAS